MKLFNSIDDLDLDGKRVLIRADLNVPMQKGQILDATRLNRIVPTLTDLLGRGAKVILMSHLGRPEGCVVPELSLKPVRGALEKILKKPVILTTDCIGQNTIEQIKNTPQDIVVILENLRFHRGEQANDPKFAQELAKLGEIYINDAFSCAHRAHASTEGIAKILPAAVGRLMQSELNALSAALENPEHPVGAIVGGAKISTKLTVLGNLVNKVDKLIIGGAMANTFLLAEGFSVGNSFCEKNMLSEVHSIQAEAHRCNCQIILPKDAIVTDCLVEGRRNEIYSVGFIPEDKMIVDIGPESIKRLIDDLLQLKTIVWNGPLGAFEYKPFDNATNIIAQEAARLTIKKDLVSIAGGGDTMSALINAGVQDKFSYVSSAGGAFLEWMEGKDLPGVAILRTKIN